MSKAAVSRYDVVAVVESAFRPRQSCHRHDGLCCICFVDVIDVAVDSISHGAFAGGTS